MSTSHSRKSEYVGVYDLDTSKEINCYTDWEGRMPANTNLLDDKTHLIYCGDLIDRGMNSIKLMQTMIARKERLPTSTILCMGNRDINKIRVAFELLIAQVKVNNDDTIPIKPIYTNYKMMDVLEFANDITNNWKTKYRFRFSSKDLKPLIQDRAPWKGNGWNEEKYNNTFSENLEERVINLYKNTFGISGDAEIESIAKEFYCMKKSKNVNDLNDAEKSEFDRLKYAISAIINSVMGVEWDEGFLSDDLKIINGLFIKYLSCTDIIACFKYGDKYGFASHSGLPKDLFETGKFIISEPLGKVIELKEETKNSVIEVIRTLNNTKNLFLSTMTFNQLNVPILTSKGMINPNNIRNSALYNAYILMSAESGEITITDPRFGLREDDNLPLNYKLSPIVYNKSGEMPSHGFSFSFERGTSRRAEPRPPLAGGDSYAILEEPNSETNSKFYNIFGHKPKAFFPQVARVGNVYHICLDISRTEDKNNSIDMTKPLQTFAKLTIKPSLSNTTDTIFVSVFLENVNYSVIPETVDTEQTIPSYVSSLLSHSGIIQVTRTVDVFADLYDLKCKMSKDDKQVLDNVLYATYLDSENTNTIVTVSHTKNKFDKIVNIQSESSGGSKKITFYRNGKKYKRAIQENKRGTKCVKCDGKLVPISKLKQCNTE